MIKNSADAFSHELGGDLRLLGEEIRPAEDIGDRIDLLAIDKDGSAVIFELKRGGHKLHLLQALRYAAMVSKWDRNRFINEYSRYSREIPGRIRTGFGNAILAKTTIFDDPDKANASLRDSETDYLASCQGIPGVDTYVLRKAFDVTF